MEEGSLYHLKKARELQFRRIADTADTIVSPLLYTHWLHL